MFDLQLELPNLVLLVLANKQDIEGAMSVDEVADKLGLHTLRHHSWYKNITSLESLILSGES